MEKDIKILRCENIGELATIGLIDLLNEDNNYDLNELKKQALEHLIKTYRELEKENTRLKKLVPAGFYPDINTDYLKKIEQRSK